MSSPEKAKTRDLKVSPDVRAILERMQQNGLRLASLETPSEIGKKKKKDSRNVSLRAYLLKNPSQKKDLAEKIRVGLSLGKATKVINATIDDPKKHFHRTSLTSLGHRLCKEAGLKDDTKNIRKVIIDFLEN